VLDGLHIDSARSAAHRGYALMRITDSGRKHRRGGPAQPGDAARCAV
jgi:hypothetical protein